MDGWTASKSHVIDDYQATWLVTYIDQQLAITQQYTRNLHLKCVNGRELLDGTFVLLISKLQLGE